MILCSKVRPDGVKLGFCFIEAMYNAKDTINVKYMCQSFYVYYSWKDFEAKHASRSDIKLDQYKKAFNDCFNVKKEG